MSLSAKPDRGKTDEEYALELGEVKRKHLQNIVMLAEFYKDRVKCLQAQREQDEDNLEKEADNQFAQREYSDQLAIRIARRKFVQNARKFARNALLLNLGYCQARTSEMSRYFQRLKAMDDDMTTQLARMLVQVPGDGKRTARERKRRILSLLGY